MWKSGKESWNMIGEKEHRKANRDRRKQRWRLGRKKATKEELGRAAKVRRKEEDEESQKMGAKTLMFPNQLRCWHGLALLSFLPQSTLLPECSYLKQITALSFCYRIPGTPVAHRVGLILCRGLQSCSIATPLYVPYTDTMSTSWTNIPSPL